MLGSVQIQRQSIIVHIQVEGLTKQLFNEFVQSIQEM